MSDKSVQKIKVRFTSQQMVFLEQIKNENLFGETMEDVLLALFREQAKTLVSQGRN